MAEIIFSIDKVFTPPPSVELERDRSILIRTKLSIIQKVEDGKIAHNYMTIYQEAIFLLY